MQSGTPPQLGSSPRPPRAKPRGFTLAELLVVIAIIVIASLISIPSLVYLFKNSATSQALVQMQAALAQARALAITTHAPAAAIFYEDPGYTGESAVFYATAAPGQGDPSIYLGPIGSSTPYYFLADPAVQPQFFPKGIYVAGYVGPFAKNLGQAAATTSTSSVDGTNTGQMDSASGYTGYQFPDPKNLGQLTSGSPSTTNPADAADPLRAVVFMPNGRSAICPYFAVENVPQDNPSVAPPPGAIYLGMGPSCIGLSVYDAPQLTSAQRASQAALGSYLVPSPTGTPPYATYVPLYVINTYTGELVGGVK